MGTSIFSLKFTVSIISNFRLTFKKISESVLTVKNHHNVSFRIWEGIFKKDRKIRRTKDLIIPKRFRQKFHSLSLWITLLTFSMLSGTISSTL